MKLWSFYVDLEESIGSVETTKAAYDKIMELRIANAQIIVNYASFLEENKYFEESFKVYERGIELFTYPVVFEIWNIYLSKFVKRFVSAVSWRLRYPFTDIFVCRVDRNWSVLVTCSSKRWNNVPRNSAKPSTLCIANWKKSMDWPGAP